MFSAHPLLLTFAAVAGLFASPVLARDKPLAPAGPQQFATLAEHVRGAPETVLYEGLPHQYGEHSAFRRELDAKPTRELGGYHFYRRPLTLNAGDAATLRALCADPASYRAYTGPKRCGGFHPDYAVAWRDGGRTVYFLVCLGCHEVETVGSGHEWIADLLPPAYARFRAILLPYHAQRPPRQRG